MIFRVGKRWTDEQVAIRIAQIVTGHSRKQDDELTPYDKANKKDNPPWKVNDKWQIDCGNDWWLHKVEGTNNQYSLEYRYSSTPERKKMLTDIIPFLEFVFFYQD